MPKRQIVVIIGPDPAHAIDLTAFRAVRNQTGIPFTRLVDKTFDEIVDHIRRIQTQTDDIIDLHISAHMSADGIVLRDRPVGGGDPTPTIIPAHRFSPYFGRTDHLFLAGCESAALGDFLGVVPNVLTVLETIDNPSARMMTELFWVAIGRGYSALEALGFCRQRLPDIGEYAFLHHQPSFLAA